jgi:hypothetical protein
MKLPAPAYRQEGEASSRLAREPFRALQKVMTKTEITMNEAAIRAANPDGILCSDHDIKPLARTSINRPTIAADFHWDKSGRDAPPIRAQR